MGIDKPAVKRFAEYIKEREAIRILKEGGAPRPWTKDPILQKYKFTNVHRSHDFTTRQFLSAYLSPRYLRMKPSLLLYQCGLARYFGLFETFAEIGPQTQHDPKHLRLVVASRRSRKLKVFTGAYIITNGGRSEPKEHVVIEYLGGLYEAARDIVQVMQDTRRWQQGYEAMHELDGFGGSGFMAKEVLMDFLMCNRLELDDAASFTPIGPGARRGLNRMYGRAPRPTHQQSAQQYMDDCQELRGLVAPMVGDHRLGISLTASDVQFCLCEFDKYERARLGQGRPRAMYTPREPNELP